MSTRRYFLEQSLKAGLLIPALQSLPISGFSAYAPAEILPSSAQKKWMDLKLGMFVHFGINTYFDKEWSDGTLDAQKFNPTQLDTDQWCAVAKKAGMKYIVAICKHHDGFCLWPSKFTEYGVVSSPFKGDVIGELAKSAQKHGLALGLYYSLWDRHEKTHDADEQAYVEFMKNQLGELLSNYGPVVELWFDGFWKKQQSGWTSKKDIEGEKVETGVAKQRDEDFINSWRNEGAYRWQMDHVYQFVKKLQPDCIVMNNSTTAYPGVPLHPVDARCGEKATSLQSDRKVWKWLGKEIYLPMQIETTMSVKGNEQFPSGNWFWHENDNSVASKQQVMEWIASAEKLGANLLINCPVTDKGKLREVDAKVLSSLR